MVVYTFCTSSSSSSFSISFSTSATCSSDTSFVIVGIYSNPDSKISCPNSSSPRDIPEFRELAVYHNDV